MSKANWDMYWKDSCPVCGSECVSGCRCPENHRRCANKHHWRRLPGGETIIESAKGIVLATLGNGVRFLVDIDHGEYGDDSSDSV